MGALFKIFKSDGITEITNIKSVIYREAVNTGEHLRPGCVCSASVDVEVFNTQANAVAAGDVIYAYSYDNANNGTLLGKFNCEPKIDTKKSYKFTAYDNALKLNADFSQWLQANQSSFPMTVYALVSAACTVAGVTLGTAAWPLSTQNVQAFYADGLTCRDILSYAAELSGKFVRCHTDGKIYIEWYTYSANSIAPSAGTGIYAYKQDGLTYANYTTTSLARVAVHPSGEDDVAYIYPTGVTSGNTLHIKNNLLLSGADASFYNAAAQQVYTAVSAVGSYCPMSVSLFPRENPFHAGDIVSITDAQGVTFSAPVTSMTLSNAAATLISEGRETYEDTTEISKAITQLASDVVRINKLKVSWAEIDQAIITYLTANDVTAQNLTIVDAADNVLATFNNSGIKLGNNATGYVLIDQDSFEQFAANGVSVLHIGNAEGTTEFTEEKTSTDTPSLILRYNIQSVLRVLVDGVLLSPSKYSFTHNIVSLSPAIMGTHIFSVTYTTSDAVYYYDLGQRISGSFIGKDSVVSGYRPTASGDNSVSLGGQNNAASASSSAVVGGDNNEANGRNSASLGGSYNVASGNNSVAIGGQHNTAQGTDQVVFGHYNDPQSNYAEIVGNGADDNNRSNARTLDWSGNEVLAGGLTTGDDVSVTGDITATGALGGASVSVTGNATVGGDVSVTGDATIGGDLSVSGGFTPSSPIAVANGGTGANNATDALTNLGAVAKTGDTMTGNLVFSGGWVIRNLPASMSNGTNYYVARFTNSDSTIRGGLAAYNSSANGKGIRLVTTQNGLSNGIGLYFDANDNPSVVLGQPAAWRDALDVVPKYSAGDTVSFPSSGSSYYQRFHGDWRYAYTLYFFIPLARSCEGLTATVSGNIYLVTNKTRSSVNLSNVATVNCFCAPGGVAVQLNWGSGNAPSYGQSQYDIASVQPYGMTITFS